MKVNSFGRKLQSVKGVVQTNYNCKPALAARSPLSVSASYPGLSSRTSIRNYDRISWRRSIPSVQHISGNNVRSICPAAGALADSLATDSLSAAVVGELLLRNWLGVNHSVKLDLKQEIAPLRDTQCELTVTATAVSAGDRQHILLAFVITNALQTSSSSSSSSRPGSAGFSVTDLRRPVLHWGCVRKQRDRWQPPPAGWSTWPDVSHDARGGAWQTPFSEQDLPGLGPALTLLLQLPADGPLSSGGLSFLVKAGSNSWLGNAATYSDFFFPTGGIGFIAAEEVAAAAAGGADGVSRLLAGPEKTLDLKRLATTPKQQQQNGHNGHNSHNNSKHDNNSWNNNHHEQQQQQHAQEPELPNAGRRAKEPAVDETQVCKLTAAELHAAAAAQLAAYTAQQTDLQLPTGNDITITQHEFPVKGHPNTPFVVASTAVWRTPTAASSSSSSGDAVLLLAAVGDVGLTGTRAPGIVMHWSAVEDEKVAVKTDAVTSGDVSVLPDGWSTLPDLSWDSGAGFWDTPMTRHFFKSPPAAAAAGGSSALSRPASPSFARVMGSDPSTPADMYMMLMRLPLRDVLCSGGIIFALRTARRQWISHAQTSGPFFLSTAQHAQRMGVTAAAAAPNAPIGGGGSSNAPAAAAPPVHIAPTGSSSTGNAPTAIPNAPTGGSSSSSNAPAAAAVDYSGPTWECTHQALIAAGLSEEDIQAYAAAMPAAAMPAAAMPAAGPGLNRPAATATAAAAAGSSTTGSNSSRSSVTEPLRSADADMLEHIKQQSMLNLTADFIPVQLDYNAAKRKPSPPIGFDAPSSSSSSSMNGSSVLASPSVGLPVLGTESSAAASSSSGSKEQGTVKFLREFEPEAVSLNHAAWGLVEADITSDTVAAADLDLHHDLITKIGHLEHKARRSLMHRYGIAADLIYELLPDLRAAAAAAPQSLSWPNALTHQCMDTAAAAAAERGRRGLSGLVAVAVWLRFSALRLLTWNHNYNVKPREISAALHRLGASLVEVCEVAPQLSGIVLLALSSAGRGGEGDMGQRIRDEILAIQQKNNCKGGMMEEWHQKLHNNSSPDDLAICQALLDYLANGQQQQVYWDSLAKEGIDAARLASYDRPIRSPPPVFNEQQVAGLTEDLVAYRRTLAAVHSGADLAAAIDGVLGYDAGECKGKRVKVDPLTAVATPQLKQLLAALLLIVQGSSSSSSGGGSPGQSRSQTPVNGSSNGQGFSKISAMLDMERCVKVQALVTAARSCLAPHIRAGNKACQGRLRDVLFLDLALELTGKTALDGGLAAVKAAAPSTLLGGLLALLQQPVAAACFSSLPGQGGNAALVAVCRQLQKLSRDCQGLDATAKARHALSLIERLRSLLAAASASATAVLQPTAAALAAALNIEGRESQLGPVALLAEEVVRGSAAASLSLLLAAVEPSLRRLAGVSAWSIISRLPSSVTGRLTPQIPCLSQLTDQDLSGFIRLDTILVLQRLAGEEEVPAGVVGVVVLGDCPDVLSHAAVRARNCRVPVVACPSSESGEVAQILASAGRHVQLSIVGDDVKITEVPETAADPAAADPAAAAGNSAAAAATTLVHKEAWLGDDWVLTSDQFTPAAVGAKAMSAASLAAAAAPSSSSSNASGTVSLPSWLYVPPSVSLPHGVFEAVVAAAENQGVRDQLQQMIGRVAAAAAAAGGTSVGHLEGDLQHLKNLVNQLQLPAKLQQDLLQHLTHLAAAAAAHPSTSSNAPPDAYEWSNVWSSIKSVWASQWNSRAVAALSKAQLPMQHLRMGVLLQPLLPARYSWVAHTVNPATGSADEVVVQLVVGLGEVLVGNHPGRALGGVIKRDSLTAALQQSSSSSSGGDSLTVPDADALLNVVDVVSYPSKNAAVVPHGMLLPCGVAAAAVDNGSSSGAGAVFMARSDSNAEDLPGFAGAGLFDSIPTIPPQTCLLDYSNEPLVWDRTAASALLWSCALAAVAAEQTVMQQQQESGVNAGTDVEGCVTADGRIWLLQARPQV